MSKKFPSRNLSLSSLNDLWKKIDQTGTVNHKPGSEFKMHAAQSVKAVEELVLSQENAQGTHRMSSDVHLRSRKAHRTSAVARGHILETS